MTNARHLKSPGRPARTTSQVSDQKLPIAAKRATRTGRGPGRPRKLPPDQQAIKDALTTRMEAIKEQLNVLGLDETSLNAFVKKMWAWLLVDDVNFSPVAARILGRAFIKDKTDADNPQELPLSGLDAAIQSMLGSSGNTGKTVTENVQSAQQPAQPESHVAQPASDRKPGPERGSKDSKRLPN